MVRQYESDAQVSGGVVARPSFARYAKPAARTSTVGGRLLAPSQREEPDPLPPSWEEPPPPMETPSTVDPDSGDAITPDPIGDSHPLE